LEKLTWIFILTFLLVLSSLQAHSHTVYVAEVPTTQVIVVNEAPPAPVVEQVSRCPGNNYALVDGHWAWNGQWVWKKHEWVIKPYSNAYWEPAHWHWSHHHQGYVWEAGHWK
jgi:hypothetical protein